MPDSHVGSKPPLAIAIAAAAAAIAIAAAAACPIVVGECCPLTYIHIRGA